MAGTYATLLGVYVDEFTSGWTQLLETAAYQFRTSDSISQLTDALTVLGDFATQTDTLIKTINGGTLSEDDAKEQAESLEMLLAAKVMAVTSLMNGVEVLDQDNLKKAASLDQSNLKVMAGNLKIGTDATLLKNLNIFTAAAGVGMASAIQKNYDGSSDTNIYARLAKDLASAPTAQDAELLAWNNAYSGAPESPSV